MLLLLLSLVAAKPFVADLQRRQVMNTLLLSSTGIPVGWMAGGFLYFLVPPGNGGGTTALLARDAVGDVVKETTWTNAHSYPERALVQGLKGDAHYLISRPTGTLESYALNAVCTHLGCVVPWNKAAKKFMCPCHGSQYDERGTVVRGPAPLSLALAHVNINPNDEVELSEWTETDFRTGESPWWKK